VNRTLLRAHQVVAYLLGGTVVISIIAGWPAWVTVLIITLIAANIVMPFQYAWWRAVRQERDRG
jgi:hypothetical protein